MGILGDQIGANRHLLEDTQLRVKRMELDQQKHAGRINVENKADNTW